MSKVKDKSTLKYIISLFGLFAISFLVLILTHMYFLNLVANLDKKTKNQESKIKISGFIIEDIAKIRSSFFEMSAGTSDENGIKFFYEDIQSNILSINKSLNILDKGGVLERDIASNLIQINYVAGSVEDSIFISKKAIQSKLAEFLKIVDELSIVLYDKNKYMKEKNFQLLKTMKTIKKINKSMPSFFNKIHNDINEVILGAESKLNEIRFEIASKKKQYNYMELILIIITLFLSLVFALKIAKQIFEMHKILTLKSKKLHAILDSTDNMVIVTDGKKINLGNDTFLNFFDYKSIEAFSQDYDCICEKFLDHEDYFSLRLLKEGENWIEYVQEQKSVQKIVTIMNRNFEPRSFSINIKEYKEETYKYVISFADITEIKIESKRYEKLATFDSLTNIYNRQKFSEVFDYELNRKKRYGTDLALIILDIDYFKKVNDTYGHDIGDHVLINFAKIVKENIRIQDTFARWGGEEFVILLPQTDLDGVMTIAEKIRAIVENNVEVKIPQITTSVGVTLINSKDSRKNAFIRVDEALYKAKNSGRNCVIFAKKNEVIV